MKIFKINLLHIRKNGKNPCLIFFFLFFTPLALSAQKKSIKFKPLIGVRIFDDKNIGGVAHGKRARRQTALTVGFEIESNEHPISLSFQRDYWAELYPFNSVDTVAFLPSLLISSERIDHVILYWQRKRKTFGIGHYWRTIESLGTHTFPGGASNKYKGLEFSIAHSLSWIDIEYRQRINYSPIFELVSRSLGSLHFIYKIGSQDESTSANEKYNNKILVNGILGSRFFCPKGIETISGEQLDFIGVSSVFGLEFLWKKHNLSFNLDKDFWIGINSGSFSRNLKGYISNTALGIKYHQELKKGVHLRYGLSATWIDDYQNNRDNRGPNPKVIKLRYSDFGIGANVSYEFQKDWDIEAKHTFTLVDDESTFTLRRFSIGLIHRINPSR